MSDLGTPGGMGSLAYGVNGVGQVVGTASISTASADQHAVLFDQVSIVDLGTQGGGSYGYATNTAMQIVGLAFIAGNSALHPFLYSNGVMFDLNTLVDPASGWTLTDARDINGSGQISGSGLFAGQRHAVLLKPVPEPPTAVLANAGLAFFAPRAGSGGASGRWPRKGGMAAWAGRRAGSAPA